MEFFKSKQTATIHRESWDGTKETQKGFQSVTAANGALTVGLAQIGAIPIETSVNDFDGKEVIALEKIGNSKLWGETGYSVLPDGQIPV